MRTRTRKDGKKEALEDQSSMYNVHSPVVAICNNNCFLCHMKKHYKQLKKKEDIHTNKNLYKYRTIFILKMFDIHTNRYWYT